MGQSQNKPLRRQCLTASESTEFRPCAVCIGVGAGSLPLFLAPHFPGMLVQAVDLDPVVLEAASGAMGFPLERSLIPTTCARIRVSAHASACAACLCRPKEGADLHLATNEYVHTLLHMHAESRQLYAGRGWRCIRRMASPSSAAD